MGTYLIIGSGEGQLDCGKVEESHSEINPGARHDCNGKYIYQYKQSPHIFIPSQADK